jgi:hypothetical protein
MPRRKKVEAGKGEAGKGTPVKDGESMTQCHDKGKDGKGKAGKCDLLGNVFATVACCLSGAHNCLGLLFVSKIVMDRVEALLENQLDINPEFMALLFDVEDKWICDNDIMVIVDVHGTMEEIQEHSPNLIKNLGPNRVAEIFVAARKRFLNDYYSQEVQAAHITGRLYKEAKALDAVLPCVHMMFQPKEAAGNPDEATTDSYDEGELVLDDPDASQAAPEPKKRKHPSEGTRSSSSSSKG